MDGAPLNYLTAAGDRANTILPLTWATIAISVAVTLVIFALVGVGSWHGRQPEGAVSEVTGGESPVRWVWIGVGVSTAILFATAVWTLYALSALAAGDEKPDVSIEVTGHQWWWEIRYLSETPAQVFTTANELHIPVGARVRVVLQSSDVIHSFWVPQLGGKTDAIPGQRNVAWLQASKPGTFIGQCSEYCGQQHAHMGLRVVAETPEAFERWRAGQRRPVQPMPPDSEAARGERVFEARCGGCHRVRGTLAGGVLGPDLTHLATRDTIAAGTLPNKPAFLSAWIADPQHIKPGTKMPAMKLSGPQLQAIRQFLAGTG